MSSWAAAFAVALMLGQADAPADLPARGPLTSATVLPGFRIHVEISEELEPDAIRALVQPGVVLWVRTRSNVLRQSLVENLARAPDVFVQLKRPLKPGEISQLRRMPQAGVWVSDEDLEDPGVRALGPRRLAVEISGELSAERAERVGRARPAHVRWRTPGVPSLLAWAEFSGLPGAKLLRADVPVPCGELLGRGRTSGISVWRSGVAGPRGCAYPPRVRVGPDIADKQLQRIALEDPASELELVVGDDVRAAYAAQKLLQRLAAASVNR